MKKREFRKRWEKEEEKCAHSFPFLALSNSKIITLEASQLSNF
jgi:hypothetical protein